MLNIFFHKVDFRYKDDISRILNDPLHPIDKICHLGAQAGVCCTIENAEEVIAEFYLAKENWELDQAIMMYNVETFVSDQKRKPPKFGKPIPRKAESMAPPKITLTDHTERSLAE